MRTSRKQFDLSEYVFPVLEQTKAEVLFAHALLHIEPEKIVGGSKERQAWMKLLMDIEVYILEHDMDMDIFKKEMGIL